jgi:pimeloyl-ACP methyl ester carboxylesterase
LAILLTLAGLGCWPASSPASSSLDFLPCPGEQQFSCAQLPVPLERSGAVGGTIALSLERKLAGSQPSSSALLALAGGPGQPALPFGSFTAQVMASALRSRDLLVFDQRGTGESDPLGCPALETFSNSPVATVYRRCAEQIGPVRGGFTTEESVQDIEALRQAAGYEKLVLYGTSYGTKVAEQYAERYPQHVEALVLDSVVPPAGREPFQIPSFQAVPGIVRELCAQSLCAGITSEPLADITRLIDRLRKRPLSGSVYDGTGHRHNVSLDETGLLYILEAGDENPALRALLPAAVVSALHGNPDAILRLEAMSAGLVPNLPESQHVAEPAKETDEAVFAATTCEETPFPWQRSAGASQRLAEARAYLAAQPASDFAPFDAATAFASSPVQACSEWPDASPPPAATTALPDVPTLILSGAQDLRTPTSGARTLAAQIPDAQLLVVPFTGHSVIGSDLTDCAVKAVSAFFSGSAVQQCTAKDLLPPTPVTPAALGAVHPPHGLAGRPGRTLVAVLDTLRDLSRQEIAATIQVNAPLPSGSSFGGLHGGYARLTGKAAILKDFTLVPGVALTGTFPVRKGRLQTATIRVGGAQAAAGTVRVGSGSKRVTGTLGGHRFDLVLAEVRVSSAGAGEWPSAPVLLSRLGAEGGREALSLPLPSL